jgi:hypothetical protein
LSAKQRCKRAQQKADHVLVMTCDADMRSKL